MAEARQALTEEERRLAEYERYRGEYQRSLERETLDAERLQDYRAFLTNLNRVIELQRRKVGEARRAYEDKQSAWRGLRARSRALDKAVTRLRGEEVRQEARREQKDSDDRAQWPRRREDPAGG